jgi:hypothetical protein
VRSALSSAAAGTDAGASPASVEICDQDLLAGGRLATDGYPPADRGRARFDIRCGWLLEDDRRQAEAERRNDAADSCRKIEMHDLPQLDFVHFFYTRGERETREGREVRKFRLFRVLRLVPIFCCRRILSLLFLRQVSAPTKVTS